MSLILLGAIQQSILAFFKLTAMNIHCIQPISWSTPLVPLPVIKDRENGKKANRWNLK